MLPIQSSPVTSGLRELSNLTKISVDTVTYPAVTPVLVLPWNESRRREVTESRPTTSLTPGAHTSTERWPLLQLPAITSLQFGSSLGRSSRMRFSVVLLSVSWDCRRGRRREGYRGKPGFCPLPNFWIKSKLKKGIYQILIFFFFHGFTAPVRPWPPFQFHDHFCRR
jgi:hypothetical protein